MTQYMGLTFGVVAVASAIIAMRFANEPDLRVSKACGVFCTLFLTASVTLLMK